MNQQVYDPPIERNDYGYPIRTMNYTLYNKLNGHTLDHPRVGLWYTNSLETASEMYDACLEYLTAADLKELIPHMAVVDADTHEEINLLTGSRSCLA